MAVLDRRDGVAGDIVTVDRRGGIADNIAIKRACLAASATNITLAGLQTIDGVVLVAGDRVLVTGQTTASQNGIYDASSGNWTRSADADGNSEWEYGTLVFVVSGTNYARSWWYLATTGSITVDTTSLTFTQTTLETFLQSGTGAVSRTYLAKARESFSVLDFIPVAEHAAIQAYTSTTDLSTYIASAITALGTRYGVLFFPRGRYSVASTIVATSLRNITFQGEGGLDLTYAGTSGTVIRYTGTGSGSIINMADHRGVWWRDIQVVYTSNSFTGTSFACSTSFSTGCASGFERVSCYQITNNGHTAGQCWYLKNNVDVTFLNCYAAHADYGWIGLFNADIGETNMIRLIGCTSIALDVSGVHNPVTGWSLSGHNFELGNGGVPAGVTTGGSFDIIDLALNDCKFADCTASGTWINLANNTFNFKMSGGDLLAISGTVTGILFGGTFHGQPKIDGVYFSGLTTGINFNSGAASVGGASVQSCEFLSTTTPIANMANCSTSSIFLANTPDTANRALKAGYGGTDNSSYATGDILYATGAAVLGKLALGAASTFLKGGALPAYAALLPADLASVLPQYVVAHAEGIDFHTVADTVLTLSLPTGITRYRPSELGIYGANGDLSAASFALYTAAAAGGVAMRAITVCGVTTASDATAGNLQAVSMSVDAAFTATTLYFRITTAGAVGRTGKVYLLIKPLPA